MRSENTYKPNFAVHPGRTLDDTLEALNITQVELAQRTGLTPKTINEIIKGKNPITPDTAIRLSAVFGTSPTFWNNLQRNYVETLTRLKREENLKKEITHLQRFHCYSELVRWGYIEQTRNKKEKVVNLLKFFEVSSLELVPKVHRVAFRRSEEKNLSKESLAAWLRCGELKARGIKTRMFNRRQLIGSLEDLKKLTTEKTEVFQRELVRICASSGVAVVFLPYFRNTYVNAATRWLNSNKALIQFSLRGSRVDIFWFDFFHELAHLLRYGKKEQFIKFLEEKPTEDEKEADEFARNKLIGKSEYSHFIKRQDFSDDAIKRFADHLGISPAIVAGRLSHDYKKWDRWSHLRTRIKLLRL